jgi:hypothetical protein
VPVVRVVLEQALDLPGRQDALQALGEGGGWYVDKGDVPAEGRGQRRGDVADIHRADPPGPPLASQLSAWARKHSLEADPATALRAVLAWSRLHGFVSLEIAGNYASMSIDPDQVFEVQLATLTA